MRTFLLAIWTLILVSCLPPEVGAQCDASSANGDGSGGPLQGAVRTSQLQGQAKTTLLEGKADGTILRTGLNANRYQTDKQLILQPEEGQKDMTSVMELKLRKPAERKVQLWQSPPPQVGQTARSPVRSLPLPMIPRMPSFAEVANPPMMRPADPNAFFQMISTPRMMAPMPMLRPIPAIGAPVRIDFSEANQSFDRRLEYLRSVSGTVNGRVSLPASNTLDDRLADLRAKTALNLNHEREAVQDMSASAQAKMMDRDSDRADTEDNVLSWNAWYARLANALKEPLIQNVNAHSKTRGRDVLTVEVSSDLTIVATVKKPGNPEFDSAVLDAYRSLMFNPVLQFPTGSQRKKVVFETEQVHEHEGEAVAVETQELMNDVEHQTVVRPAPSN